MSELSYSINNKAIDISYGKNKLHIDTDLSKQTTIKMLKEMVNRESKTVSTIDNNLCSVSTNSDGSHLYFHNHNNEKIITIDFKNQLILNNNTVEATKTYIRTIKIADDVLNTDSQPDWVKRFIHLTESNLVNSNAYKLKTYIVDLLTGSFNRIILIETLSKEGFNNEYTVPIFLKELLTDKINKRDKFKMHDLFKITKHQYKLLKEYGILNHNSHREACIELFHTEWYADIEYFIEIHYTNMVENSSYYSINLSDLYNFISGYGLMLKDHNFSFRKMFDYIFVSCKRQGIDKNKDAFQLLRDYLRMALDMNITNFEKFPRYLKSYHDIMMQNYNIHLDEIKKRKYLEFKNELKPLEFKDATYQIIVPEEVTDIVNEGSELNHCVASYVESVVERSTIILFMRTIENPDKALVTLEIKNGELYFAKGNSNRNVTKEEDEFLDKFEEHLLKIKKGESV